MGDHGGLIALSMAGVGAGYIWCYLVFLRRKYEVEKRLHDYGKRLVDVQRELTETRALLIQANDALARSVAR